MIFKFLTGGVSGGGKARRWFKFQQCMSRKRWFELDREKNGPIALFDFAEFNDAVDAALIDEGPSKGGWRISDDSTIGGYSRGKFQLIRTPQDYQQAMQGKEAESLLEMLKKGEINEKDYNDTYKHDDDDDDDEVNEIDREDEDEKTLVSDHVQETKKFIPFVRWSGTINTRIAENSEVQRSGFCAIRSPEFPFGGADLGGRYNALEILCRSDGRPYSLNLKVDTFIPDDIFQTFINVPPTYEPDDPAICSDTGGRFDRVVLLFQHFIVTSGGRMRANQRDLDNSVRIQSIGLTLMDGVDGDFQFDLARIRAVNYDERGIVYNKAKLAA